MNRNMILAIVVSLAIFLPYNFLVLEPMQKQQRAAVIAERAAVQKARVEGPVAAATGPVERGVAVASGKRVAFDAPRRRRLHRARWRTHRRPFPEALPPDRRPNEPGSGVPES